MGQLLGRRGICSAFTVCLGLGIVMLLITLFYWQQQGQRFAKGRIVKMFYKPTERRNVGTQASSNNSQSIVPLSVSHSWSYVYGEEGCSTNPWRPSLYKIFQEWTNICKTNNITYVLFYGSLLGALRTGDVIPYDSDMDILVDFKNYKLIKKISAERNFVQNDGKIRLVIQPQFELNISSEARKRYTCSGKLTPTMVDNCSFQDPMARLILKYLHIDLYPFYDKGNHILDTSEGGRHKYKRKDFFPLRPCKMMGFDSLCPQNPWNTLKAYYGPSDFKPTYKCKGKVWLDKNGRKL